MISKYNVYYSCNRLLSQNFQTLNKVRINNFKNININDLISNANPDMIVLKSLNQYFAQELLSTPLNNELLPLYNNFNNELIQLININPLLFFNVVVNQEQNPNNLSYIQQNTKINVEIYNYDNSQLLITCNYLTLEANNLLYKPTSFIINGFNINKTALKTTSISIKNYQYTTSDNQVIVPSEMNIDQFRFDPRVKLILEDFINMQIKNIFVNIFSMTICNEINNNIDVINNNLVIKFKITNYVSNNGVLIFNSSTNYYTLTITGFLPLNNNPNFPSSFKTDLSIEQIQTKYGQNQDPNYPILSTLSTRMIDEYINNLGYVNQSLINELILAINSNPEFWMINPVKPNINYNNLPIVKKDHKLTIDQLNNKNSLRITGFFLCQPQYLNQVVSIQDYKQMSFEISSSNNISFGSNALANGNTTFNTNNLSVSSNVSYDNIVNINDGFNIHEIKNITIEDIDYFYKNDQNSLIRKIKLFLNKNKNNLFVNILKTTEINMLNFNASNQFYWNNNNLHIKFTLTNYFKNRILTNTNSNTFNLTIYGFKNKNNQDLINTIIIVSVVGSTIIILTIVLILILMHKNKKTKQKKAITTMYSDWKN